jgi:hypothetical protein
MLHEAERVVIRGRTCYTWQNVLFVKRGRTCCLLNVAERVVI